jgi:hypothetical protein
MSCKIDDTGRITICTRCKGSLAALRHEGDRMGCKAAQYVLAFVQLAAQEGWSLHEMTACIRALAYNSGPRTPDPL